MKTKLKALIAEQKALTARFEELLYSTTEKSSTLDPKKVYIKGHPTRGAEVIKMLEDLGGVNRIKLEGRYSESNYCLDTDYTIFALNQKNKDFSDFTELHLPEEVSTENTQNTDIKVGDWYLLDEPCLKCELSDRMMIEPFVIDKISASFDSDVAIVKFADGTQCELYKLRDKFHKVDPPKEEIELIEGEVYYVPADTRYAEIYIYQNQEKDWLCTYFPELNELWTEIPVDAHTNPIPERTPILATPEQRKQLFDALEKAGKLFDKENMRLLDVEEWRSEQGLPIIVRNETTNWRVDIFHSYDAVDAKYPFCCNASDECDRLYKYAIPYNENNLHVIGTTNTPDKHYKFVEK